MALRRVPSFVSLCEGEREREREREKVRGPADLLAIRCSIQAADIVAAITKIQLYYSVQLAFRVHSKSQQTAAC